MIVVNYSIDEIELTLKLYPISKIQLSRLSNDCSKTNISKITRKRSFDYISIQFGYANHSSIVRKYNDILKKIYLEEMRNHD